MNRCIPLLAAVGLAASPPCLRADAFDRYINPVLKKAPSVRGVQEVKQLTPDLIADNDRALPQANGALVIVKTNGNRYAKLLVQEARQRVNAATAVPILLIDRYVTYREGDERAVEAEGRNLKLFAGFRLDLDIGQVVPRELGGDIRFVVQGRKAYAEPLGKAKLYLVTQPLPGTEPRKSTKLVVGETFDQAYFNGTYHLYDDGRRSGKLVLKIGARDEVTGSYYSDKDGRRYDVTGKIGSPKHAIDFTIKFPRTQQTFHGWLFTGDGKALTGWSRLQEREAGFYAVRVEE
ncbi:MAG TPA: hypothetical protein VG013_43720 [Gemmataceae bacterium]|jgi:hypothetical protein|nr:hypothetical protein [Gemmataceae bacterium]